MITDAYRMKKQRGHRDEERRLRDNEGRRKEEDSRFQVLVTLLSPLHRPPPVCGQRVGTFPSPHNPSMTVRAANTHASRLPRHSTAPLAHFSCGCHAHRRDFSRKHVAHSPPDVAGRLFLPSFRQWRRRWGRFTTTMLASQRMPDISNSPARMLCHWTSQRILEHTPRMHLTLP
ncbi:hypothetical protein GWK47_041378 [Chionoecetes opilio]|uniref:Uncharacterized protein n=1 Tax=Chionoecetes opilio TaxID=41210 RepID=A0A8J4YI05_CHIOP|nr:hypothetical protein GWK47_041378 [Chionoecetes opilio]